MIISSTHSYHTMLRNIAYLHKVKRPYTCARYNVYAFIYSCSQFIDAFIHNSAGGFLRVSRALPVVGGREGGRQGVGECVRPPDTLLSTPQQILICFV